jgi:hypothetical protein
MRRSGGGGACTGNGPDHDDCDDTDDVGGRVRAGSDGIGFGGKDR